jgi:hypothetical protein
MYRVLLLSSPSLLLLLLLAVVVVVVAVAVVAAVTVTATAVISSIILEELFEWRIYIKFVRYNLKVLHHCHVCSR